MTENGTVSGPYVDDPDPQSGGYAVTRDSIRDLIHRLTDRAGNRFIFDKFEIWELDPAKGASFVPNRFGPTDCAGLGAPQPVTSDSIGPSLGTL